MKKLIFKILKRLGYTIYKDSKEKSYRIQRKWEFLKNVPIGTIIDIGANEGQFVAEVKEFFPQAEIYSFEPLKDCYDALNARFKDNKKVHTYNMALGEEEGETTFRRSSASPSSSLLKMNNLHKKIFPHTAGMTEERVKIKRLDDVLANVNMADNILFKIDVQGAEDKVIKGSTNILKKANIIITEISYAALYENQPLFKDIMSLLQSSDFTYIGNLEQFANPVTKAPLFADAIFIKNDVHKILYMS